MDGAGHAYVTGFTDSVYVTGFPTSRNFPTTPGAFQTSYQGGFDAFVSELNASGTGLVYSTYLGGGSGDGGNGIAVDGAGHAYVTGGTNSPNFPTTPGAFQTSLPYGSDAFVSELNATGSGLVYSTYLGGGADTGNGIAVDAAGHAYVTGEDDGAIVPTTPGAFQTSYQGGFDAFVSELNASGTGLVYSTYLGGSGFDGGNGIAVDGLGHVYVTGGTTSTNFPTTPGAFQTSNQGYADGFVTQFAAPADLQVTGGAAVAGAEGSPVTAAVGSVSDADNAGNPANLAAPDFAVTINWGDGSAPDTCTATGPTACSYSASSTPPPGVLGKVQLYACDSVIAPTTCKVQGTHSYAAEGSYSISLVVTDADQAAQPAAAASSASISPGPDDSTLTPGSTWTATEGASHTQLLGHWSDADGGTPESPDAIFAAAWPDGIDYCTTYPSSLPSCFSPSSALQLVSCNAAKTSCDVQGTHTSNAETLPGNSPIALFVTDPDQSSTVLMATIPAAVSTGPDDMTLAPGTAWTATEGSSHTQLIGHWSDVDTAPEPPDAVFAVAWPDGAVDYCTTYATTLPSCFSPSSALQLVNCNASHTSCDAQATHTTNEESEPGGSPISLFVTDPDQTSPTLTVGIPANITDAGLTATGANALTGPSNAPCSQFAPCSGLVGSFTDIDPSCTAEGEGVGPTTGAPHYAISINWGDGSASTAPTAMSQTGACSYAISGSHSYAAPGSYTVTVTITDEGCADGGTSCSITVGGPASAITNTVTVSTPASSNLTGHTTISASPAGPGTSFGFKAANTNTPPGLTGMLFYQDPTIPFFINAFGASGAALPPGMAGSPSWCSSFGGYGCSLVIDAIQCSSTLATIYGHYTTAANGQTYYFRVQVTPVTVKGPGSFQLTTNSPVGMVVSATMPAVTTIVC